MRKKKWIKEKKGQCELHSASCTPICTSLSPFPNYCMSSLFVVWPCKHDNDELCFPKHEHEEESGGNGIGDQQTADQKKDTHDWWTTNREQDEGRKRITVKLWVCSVRIMITSVPRFWMLIWYSNEGLISSYLRRFRFVRKQKERGGGGGRVNERKGKKKIRP